MKELCIVHIGMPKTGSSSLQEALFKGCIKDKTICTVNLKDMNHGLAIVSMFSNHPENYYYIKSQGWGKVEIENYNLKNKRLLIEGFTDNKSTIEILSGEDLYHMREPELSKFYLFLKEYFRNIIVIAYVRPPKSFMESAFQQIVKYHNLGNFDFKTIYHPYKNFLRFDNVFGKENVYLWKYDPTKFPNNDVAMDFCQRLNIAAEFTNTIRENESISKEVIAILFTYHKYARKTNFGFNDLTLNHLLVNYLRDLGSKRFYFSNRLIGSVLENYSDDLLWIEKRMSKSLLDEVNTLTDEGVNTEEELYALSVTMLPDLKLRLKDKNILDEFHDTPADVAKLVDLLKVQLANESNIPIIEEKRTCVDCEVDENKIYTVLEQSGLFDESFYINRYRDMLYMKEQGGNLLLHYIKNGEKEGRWPNAEFDPIWYRNRYKKIKTYKSNLLYYYVTNGRYEHQQTKAKVVNNVLIGDDEWLFLSGGTNHVLNFYTRPDFFSNSICEEWYRLLEIRRKKMMEMKIEYIHFIVPDKLTVYPEYSLEHFNHFDSHPINKLFKLYEKQLVPFVVNPVGTFSDKKKDALLYFKTDSHWTFWGCYEGFRLIMRQLNHEISKKFMEHSINKVEKIMDLGSKLDPQVTEKIEVHMFLKNAKRNYANDLVLYKENKNLHNEQGLHVGSNVIFQNQSLDAINKKVVIFGDSFSEYRPVFLTAMFAEMFAEVHFIWSTSLDYEYIACVQPDIVISEIAERFMIRVPDDTFVLSKYVDEKMASLI